MESYNEALTFLNALFGHPSISANGLKIEIVGIPPKNPDGKTGRLSYDFFDSCEAAAEAAIEIDERHHDAYVCMSALAPTRKSSRRGLADDARATVCYWADVDLVDPFVAKKNPVPKHIDDGVNVARAVGVNPSMIIHSGHGLHCYWLLQEPWIYDADKVGWVADVVRSWDKTVRRVAQSHGYVLDAVGDLARILRVPGTHNWKIPTQPKRVGILFPPSEIIHRISRYDRGELSKLQVVLPDNVQNGKIRPYNLGRTQLRAPDDDERQRVLTFIETGCMISPIFHATWNRLRSPQSFPFPSGDYSASSYDLSLATTLAGDGVTDQNIVFALYVWRELHNERPEKALRPDYIAGRLSLARETNATAADKRDADAAYKQFEAVRAARIAAESGGTPPHQSLANVPPPPMPTSVPPIASPTGGSTQGSHPGVDPCVTTRPETGHDDPTGSSPEPGNGPQSVPQDGGGVSGPPEQERERQVAIATLRRLTDIKITRVRKIGKDNSTYRFDIEGGHEVNIENSKDLHNPLALSARFYDAIKEPLRKMDEPSMRRFLKCVGSACEDVENKDLETRARYIGHIRDYVDKAPNVGDGKGSATQRTASIMTLQPYIENGRTYFHHGSFSRWLRTHGIRAKDNDFAYAYELLGVESRYVSAVDNGKKVRKRYKYIDTNMIEDEED